jgi:hypothetical protein
MAALETAAAVAMIAADVTSTVAAAAVVNAVAVTLMTALVVVAMWADCCSAFSVAYFCSWCNICSVSGFYFNGVAVSDIKAK